MKLPNAEKAIVDRAKVADYLLDAAHPDNGGKAEVASAVKSPHGKKHVIAGRIEAPGGKSAAVQTIWIVDSGLKVAGSVTAYPQTA